MILLDTQVIVWLTLERSRLSRLAAQAVRKSLRSGGGLAISDKTLWEVAMAAKRGRIDLPSSLHDYLQHLEALCLVLPINGKIAARSMEFSSGFPRDPTDKIIAATALVHSLPLVTADEPMIKSGEVPCIW